MSSAITSNCSLLAASLSANYLNATPFQAVKKPSSLRDFGADLFEEDETRLSRYLSSHGILLTMCLGRFGPGPPSGDRPRSCTIGLDEDHVAASWITHEIGYQHVIPVYPALGLIIDPLANETQIRCIYPTDSGSDGRDGKGCGPPKRDPAYGSEGASRIDPNELQNVQAKFRRYKNLNFGLVTPWHNIRCRDMFPTTMLATTWRLKEDGVVKLERNDSKSASFCRDINQTILDETALGHLPTDDPRVYATMLETIKGVYDSLMGFSVCDLAKHDPNISAGNVWMYNGPCAWHPFHWATMVDIQLEMLAMAPKMKIWNEIVLRSPPQMTDIISAVFYIVLPEMTDTDVANIQQQAALEANIFGGKPILQINATTAEPQDGTQLFTCPEPVHRA